ncbi:hypothetical protein [Peribacillus loiseleuriae]|uniref:hypothetical protein n=1 Tax=Peribacillus loiseleuriae TaxID=1679170 RepID=UPI003D0801BA
MEFLVIDNIETFKKYCQFKSVKDFNNNIEQWMIEYKQHFTTSERIALKRLIRYAAKYRAFQRPRSIRFWQPSKTRRMDTG